MYFVFVGYALLNIRINSSPFIADTNFFDFSAIFSALFFRTFNCQRDYLAFVLPSSFLYLTIFGLLFFCLLLFIFPFRSTTFLANKSCVFWVCFSLATLWQTTGFYHPLSFPPIIASTNSNYLLSEIITQLAIL